MPNRGADLVWDEPEAPASSGLCRAAIVRAALEIADVEGLGAVSIRRVADKLEARPMSLYTYIASKEDLVALMLNETSGQMLVEEPLPDDWREAVGQIARRAFDVYVAHPWMLQAFVDHTRRGPNLVRRSEQSVAAVAPLGLDPPDAWVALSTVHAWTVGHALHVVTLREDAELEAQIRGADPAERPQMARVYGSGGAEAWDTAFEASLETVLDGIAHRFGHR